MDEPKVLFILHLPPPVHGAAMVGQYIKDSARINECLDARYINLGTSTSLNDIGKSGLGKIIRFIGLLGQVFYQMMVFGPDEVYMTLTAQGSGFYKDAVVVSLAKMLGGKMMYHFHNKGVEKRQDKIVDHYLYKWVFNNAEVILLSQYLYPDVEKYVSREQVHICPNGIPDARKQLKAESLKLKEEGRDKVQILFLSNLIESKGVYVLLEACAALKKKGEAFKCIFVGGEGDISGFELAQKIAAMGLEEQVIYAGKKYDEEKEEIYRKSDIFVMPTYYPNECFPLVLLEAMQAGLPIIATPEGGIPDIVKDGETGFLVPQKDAKALAEKLEVLINHPQKRKEMGQKGHAKYKKDFTLQKFESTLIKILKKGSR